MKKIIAALSTLLVVAGVKAQTTPVNKPTEPQVTTATTNTTVNGNTVKLAHKGTVTGSKTAEKVTQKEAIKETLKVAPTIKKAGK